MQNHLTFIECVKLPQSSLNERNRLTTNFNPDARLRADGSLHWKKRPHRLRRRPGAGIRPPATLDERRGWLEAVLPPMNPIGENEVRVARAWSLPEAVWSHLQLENWWTG